MSNPDTGPLPAAAFYILLSLAGEAQHGYAMMTAIAAQTGGRVRLGPGTLYTNLQRLMGQGWIEEASRAGEDPRRRLYRLTAAGRRVLSGEVARMGEAVRAARKLGVA
jgi:DNA-binding PadR family transcriptional regulator